MTLPLNKKQKQLVEKSMDLVPIMIRSMTRTAAYVTEEEQQELCQIGYLALCRSAVGFEEGRSFQPYAKTIIRHAIFDYWRKIARDRSMLCSLDEASSEDEHLHYSGTEAEADLRGIKKEYEKRDVILFAAAIGDDKENIRRIYKDGFLDITKLEELPKNMAQLVKQHLK